ncbi:class I adenylate-forming enzyme family protein [Hydrogenophaga sp.]|uniref:class I adenylate-forming enzyme family protein n=1 Tax=Hydrogenophaga sp. TaxID=1904254 RepID=UPI0026261AC0|nr:class I adenylate-forming enzyme family protein [Hydrogenophaga sp.]MCW5653186.1 acyl--CoA ligase [Hydrogenophaga sp.]
MDARPLSDESARAAAALTGAAASLCVGDLFADQVALRPDAIALQAGDRHWTYAEMDARVNRLCHLLASRGVVRGERVAILSENRPEYAELLMAAARLGAIVACLNWRQSAEELTHCLALVGPRVALVSPRFASQAPLLRAAGVGSLLTLGDALDQTLLAMPVHAPPDAGVQPEDGLYILYTSGTTGKPKAALISHRALLARGAVGTMDRGVRRGSHFIAWPPMFHMASADNLMVTLIGGGKVIVVDGLQIDALCDAAQNEADIGWFVLMPGMVERFLDEARRRGLQPRPVDSVGCMADLVPRHQIAEVTRLFNAPFRNSFGSTETGPAPASAGRIAVGVPPDDLAKTQSALCRVRLVDEDGHDVRPGEPGELLLRSPTLFSGYWGMPEATAEAFAGGWFHTGDVFVRQPDGLLRFVDRRKYLIKSGGENIYPAEIEQLLLASPRIMDAAVVRKPDPKWGEVPVAFVARVDPSLSAEDVLALCRGRIAGYKVPREVRFMAHDDMPRSTTGKVMRHLLEERLGQETA